MRVTCKYCGGPHPAFECRKKRETAPSSDCKSDALTKEGLVAASSNLGSPTKSTAPKGEGIVPRRSAKSTSLPVDANMGNDLKASHSDETTDALRRDREQRAQVTVGETAPKFDKKAWMREYMRDHRKGILRRPKPTTKREKDE